MRRAVVPLMSAGNSVIFKLVSNRLPCLAAVIRALDDLSEPAAALRGIDPIGIDRRRFEMVDLPAAELRTADVPFLALAIGSQDERAFAGADEDSYLAHQMFL